MQDPTRRRLLETAGAGVVALGGGVACAGGRTVQQQTVGSFTATGTDGFLTIDGSDPVPGDEDNSGGTRFPVAGSGVDGNFTIQGDIFADDTWESTSTTLPSFSETRDSGNLLLGDVTISVDYSLDGAVTGTIDRLDGVVTCQLPLRVALEVSDFPGGPASGTIQADANNLTTGVSNGSATSEGLQGSASGLDTTAGSATLVDNELTLPATGTDLIDSVFSLSSQTVGRNWFSLTLDFSLPSLDLPVLQGGTAQPQDSDGDGLYEDVRGDGGGATLSDVQTLFENLDNPELQANSAAFNFQGDDRGEVGVLDVQALYDSYL